MIIKSAVASSAIARDAWLRTGSSLSVLSFVMVDKNSKEDSLKPVLLCL